MKGGAEFVVCRGAGLDYDRQVKVGRAGRRAHFRENQGGAGGHWDGSGLSGHICYRNFRRAADKPIPPGKRALVRITIEVLKVLDD